MNNSTPLTPKPKGKRKLRLEFWEIEKQVNQKIKEQQKKLKKDLIIENFGYTVRYGKKLSPGCQSCKEGRWCVMHMNTQCNLNCYFCPEYNSPKKEKEFFLPEEFFCGGVRFNDFNEWKFQFSEVYREYSGFAWIGGETVLAWQKIKPLLLYCKKEYPQYWNWLYTNGTLLNESLMQDMKKSGINELRFNLAASNFNKELIQKIVSKAGEIFEWVVVEIPMLTTTYRGLMNNIDLIIKAGVKQLNLAEFMVGPNQFSGRLKFEGKMYKYKNMLTSPVISRQLTYKVMAKAVLKKWPLVINDCSNDYKYYKNTKNHLVKRFFNPEVVNPWKSNLELESIARWNKTVNKKTGLGFVYSPANVFKKD